jgi:archaetidylinositol phosphate synthase
MTRRARGRLMTITNFAPDVLVGATTESTAGSKAASPVRVQTNMLAQAERRLLDWLCERLPARMAPDHLTAIGLGGAALAGIGYGATAWRQEFVFFACLGLVINWFGDSLDGSLARHRGIERPRIGFFIDHSVDCVSVLMILVGVGASRYATMNASLFALVGYLLMTVHVFLKNSVTGRLQLTFVNCGPTEIRITLIVFSLIAYAFGVREIDAAGTQIWPYSILLYLFGAVAIVVFTIDTLKTASLLRDEERELDRRRRVTP